MLIVLTVLAVVLFVFTNMGMARLRRGCILSLLAGLTEQKLPLEVSLQEICSRHSRSVMGLGGLQRLARLLEKGTSLCDALLALRLISMQDACVLEHAQEHGAANRVLERLATQSTRLDKRQSRTSALLAYPFLVGLVVATVTEFVQVYVLPKLATTVQEMGDGVPDCLPDYGWTKTVVMVLLSLLLLWGVFLAVVMLASSTAIAWIPGLGTHMQLQEQANLARHLAIVLESGGTVEEAIKVLDRGGGGGLFRRRLEQISLDLERGAAFPDVFRSNGTWRTEFLWGLEAIAKGAPPGATFDTLAHVLEERADERIGAIARYGTPVAVLIVGSIVVCFSCSVFQTLNALNMQML